MKLQKSKIVIKHGSYIIELIPPPPPPPPPLTIPKVDKFSQVKGSFTGHQQKKARLNGAAELFGVNRTSYSNCQEPESKWKKLE